MFMVEDAIANPTSPPHKEAIMWNDLSPVASECLRSVINLLFLLKYGRENLPCDSERDQSGKHPGWCTEQEGHSSIIPERGGECWEERIEREGNDDAGDTLH